MPAKEFNQCFQKGIRKGLEVKQFAKLQSKREGMGFNNFGSTSIQQGQRWAMVHFGATIIL